MIGKRKIVLNSRDGKESYDLIIEREPFSLIWEQ